MGKNNLIILEKLDKFKVKCECQRCQNDYIVNKYDAKKSRIGHICNNCKRFISSMDKITQENLRKAFKYNPETGSIIHRYETLNGKKNQVATYSHSSGYLSMSIGKKEYLAHRIIFMYVYGYIPEQIDHINHIRNDNRLCNLRNATHMQNCKNHSLSKKNTSGHNGVSLHKPTGKYRAYIMKNYKHIHLGLFKTKEEAILARKNADLNYEFHKNHGTRLENNDSN